MTSLDLEKEAARARVNATLFGDAPTARFGRYVLLSRIGRGANGIVWSAFDEQLNRRVALKVLPTDDASEQSRAQLRREARALAQLRHENVVAVHDVGDHDGAVFIAMELVEGSNLRTWLAERRDPALVLDVLWQAARGVAAAHDRGLIHRDIKPENILIGADGRVCVADFGLARSSASPPSPSSSSSSSSPSPSAPTSSLTSSSTHPSRGGTLLYMAPELLVGDGAEATAASDQWSLAVTACEALTGAHPFPSSTLAELVALHVEKRRPQSLPKGPARAAIERALSHDPAARFASVAAFAQALRPPQRRSWPVVVGAVVVAAGIGVAVAAPASEDCGLVDDVAAVWGDAAKATLTKHLKDDVHQDDAAVAAVVAGLDRYRASVKDVGAAVCVARQQGKLAPDDHDRRRACLERAPAAVASLLEKLNGPDVSFAARAGRGVAVLPDPATCNDAASLRIFVPVDKAARAAADAVDRKSQEAEQLRVLGKLKEAVAAADDAVRAGAGFDLPANRGGALLAKGLALDAAGGDPWDIYQESVALGLRGGDDNTTVASLYALAFLTSERDDDAKRGALLASLGRVVAERLPDDPPERRRSRRLSELSAIGCSIAMKRHDLDAAEAACLETVRLKEAAGGRQHPAAIAALQAVGVVYVMKHDAPRALRTFQEAIDRLTPIVGDKHPVTLAMRLGLGTAQREAGDLDAALATTVAARDDLVAAAGEEHPDVAESLREEARIELLRQHPAAALAAARKANELTVKGEGKDSVVVLDGLDVLGRAELAAGDVAAARKTFQRAYAWAVRVHGEDDPDTVVHAQNLALVK